MSLALALPVAGASATAAAQPTVHPARIGARPLSDLLNRDGTLDLSRGVRGALDPSGYTMLTDPSGAPRFVPSGSAAAASTIPAGSAWDDRFGDPGTGTNDYAIAVNGTDVYVGGRFTKVGLMPANYIAKWNGTSWSALGSGLAGSDTKVNAIAVSGTDVYVGGDFTSAGGVTAHSIAKWNGTSWSALGSGLVRDTYGSNGIADAIALINGTVYVGGDFITAGGVDAIGIAKWNGSWSGVGGGVTTTGGCCPGHVYALAANATNLYVGGEFDHAGAISASSIAKWNGTSWSALGSGVTRSTGGIGQVDAIALNGSDVYVGGEFASAGGSSASEIARWNGTSWSALGSGLTSSSGSGTVKAIAFTGGALYTGGLFNMAGGTTSPYIARWNGSAWSALPPSLDGEVYAVAANPAGGVFTGGYFNRAGTIALNNIGRYDGTNWLTLGDGITLGGGSGNVGAVAVTSGGQAYAGGYFTNSGSAVASNVAQWDGSRWNALGSGVSGGNVYAIAVNGTDVYVGGSFTSAGGISANNIAKWNGSAWSSLGSGVSGSVYALGIQGGYLYVGGGFTAAGPTNAQYLARWSLSSSTWSKLGTGLSFGGGAVRALAFYGTQYLEVGGTFTTVYAPSAITVNGLLEWAVDTDNWYLIGDGVVYSGGYAARVYALAVIGGDLYVGGNFDQAGTGNNNSNVVTTRSIARLNLPANTWYSLAGSGVGGDFSLVNALAVDGTDLYVGGEFTAVSGTSANYVAKWNGSAWSALGSGIGAFDSLRFTEIDALAVGGGSLWAGGQFSAAGGTPSYNFARWGAKSSVAKPTLKLSLTAGPPGTVVTVTGTGFQPGEYVKLTFLDVATGTSYPLGKALADGSGAISKSVTIPQVAAGTDKVKAKGLTSLLKASKTFTVT